MKKKILALCLIVALMATAIAGATLAYFTDADADKNVMTAGNVKIVQNETDRAGNAWSENNEAHLVPAVYLKDGKPYNPTTISEGPAGGTSTTYTDDNGDTQNVVNPATDKETLGLFTDNINNEIDKIISVTNKGTEAAYIRTIVLMENKADNKICEKIHGVWCNDDGQYRVWLTDDKGVEVTVYIDNVPYSVAVCQYKTALEAGKTSSPSLCQVWLDPSTTNDWYDLLGGDGSFNILSLSQAVQTDGFTDAATALNTAFGEVNKANVEKWFAETAIDTAGLGNVVGGQTNN